METNKPSIESTPGKGSGFHIYLPEIIDPVEDSKTIEKEKTIFTGSERILVVDDEPPIVQMLKKTLERLGSPVVGRTSGMEALELFKAKPDQFDLIITDITMPHMTGYQLSRQLIEIRSDIPIVLCSGFHERISEETTKEIGIREIIMKPILQHVLSQTIRKALDESKI